MIDIAERVSSGEIAVHFTRPVDLQLAWWAPDMGRASFQLLSRGPPPLFIGAVTVGITWPDSWSAYPLGSMSLFLAVWISLTLRFLVNLIAFWTFDVADSLGSTSSSAVSSAACSFQFTSCRSGSDSWPTPHRSRRCCRRRSMCSRLGCRGACCQPAWLASRPRRPRQAGAVVGHSSTRGAGWLSSRPRRLIAELPVKAAAHIGSDLDGQRQGLAFSPKETTQRGVLAEVSAVTEVVDLTLEEPAIQDIVRTLVRGSADSVTKRPLSG